MADDIDGTDDWMRDDEDALLAAWEEADRQAAQVLREACPFELRSPAPQEQLVRASASLRGGLAGRRSPYDYFVNACGWEREAPDGDVELWISALACTLSPPNDPGIDIEQAAAVAALLHADWLGMVVGLVRRGAGAEFSPEAAQHDIDTLPELEGAIEDPDGAFEVLSTAVTTLTPLWQALSVLDDEERLTELGCWGLPNALLVTWSVPESDADLGRGHESPVERLDEAEAEQVLTVLARHPMTLEELRREAAKEGVFASMEQLTASLIWRLEVYESDDGIWAHLPTLADGVVLTHRVTEDEVRLGVLGADLDLDLPGLLALDGYPLAGGGEVKSRFHSDDAPMPDEARTCLAGPEGWLDGFDAGDLLGVRYAGGELAVERAQVPPEEETRADVRAVVEAARETADYDARHGDPDYPGVTGNEIVVRCRRSRPEAFSTPLPPLTEILAGVDGLEVHHGFVGVAGTAWQGEPSWLDEEERSTYRTWHRTLDAHRRDGSVPEPAELVSLAESLRGRLLALVATDLTSDPDREPVAVAMAAAVSDRPAAVPEYLRACAGQGRGDAAAWLAHLEAAVAADDTCDEALGDLADLRSLAGDAREAHRLYGLAGLESTAPEMQILTRFLQPPEGVGRNKPCPCGSGKKYKVCHGRTDSHQLSSRAPWLWHKLATFCQRGPNRSVLLDWAELLTGGPRESREVVFRAMGDPFVVDLAAFGGGLLGRFLEVLGPLLPVDERALAERWVGSPLRLMEVEQVRPMRGVVARDLLSGEQIEVLDRRLTTDVEAKDVLLGRPLDDGGGDMRLQVSPLLIPRLMRSRVLTVLQEGGDEASVARLLGDAARPPETTTTEGEELVLCTARYELAAPDEAWDALASEMTPGGDTAVLLDEADVTGHGSVVRGSVRREGTRLVVESNAIERFRRIQERVLAADPGARLVDESTRPMASVLEEGIADDGAFSSHGDARELDPALVGEVVRQHEVRWLDDHVPALQGRTPREAAKDPDLRAELVALLDDFEWQDRRNPSPFAMDVPRLRRELGIDGA